MKPVHPLLLLIACVALVVGGLFWKMRNAEQCTEQGGAVAAPLTRGQTCIGR